jgi:hydroxyacylglutathione hydrolase
MPLEINPLVLSPFETNCYVLVIEEECWVVDPGVGASPLLRFLEERKLSPRRILLTHGHGDHIAGVHEVKWRFPDARVCCPGGDEFMLRDPTANLSGLFGFPLTVPNPDELLHPHQTLMMGDLGWEMLDTSGHSPGGMSFYCAREKVVLTGDSLFAGGIGRTDFPSADPARLLANIRQYLLTLPDDTRVLPGHGAASTIGRERRTNPFLTRE